jgi:hypothetical protein
LLDWARRGVCDRELTSTTSCNHGAARFLNIMIGSRNN